MDDRAGEAAIETYGVDANEDVLVGVLKNIGIYETEGSLDDPQGHIDIFVFIFQQDDDIDYVVKNGIHLLAEARPLEHLQSLLPL